MYQIWNTGHWGVTPRLCAKFAFQHKEQTCNAYLWEIWNVLCYMLTDPSLDEDHVIWWRTKKWLLPWVCFLQVWPGFCTPRWYVQVLASRYSPVLRECPSQVLADGRRWRDDNTAPYTDAFLPAGPGHSPQAGYGYTQTYTTLSGFFFTQELKVKNILLWQFELNVNSLIKVSLVLQNSRY